MCIVYLNYQSANSFPFLYVSYRYEMLFMDDGIKFPQVIPVHNTKLYKVTAAADFQLFADPSLVVLNAFRLNDEAGGYFGRSQAVGNEG